MTCLRNRPSSCGARIRATFGNRAARDANDCSIAVLAKPFQRIARREFECVSRIYPFIPYRWVRRALFRLDRALMRIKPLRRFASVVCFGLYRD